MRMKKQILIILILISSVLTINAKICTVASPHLDVQGPLYTRGNILTLSKAQNDWIPWATRNISTSEATIDLFNINNAFFQGNVGIGTATPVSRLHIGCGNNEGILIGNYNDKLGWDGTSSQPGYHIRFAGYRDIVSNFTGARISALRTNQCCNALAQGMELVFSVSQGAGAAGDANLIEAIRINSVGNVGIGTVNPTFKLDVAGTIRA